MSVLVTGVAGFIGFHVSRALLSRGETVIGIDILNDYYDVSLKQARLKLLSEDPRFSFEKIDISDRESVMALSEKYPHITRIVHLAAQAGVRYSLIDPYSYIHTNVMGHLVLMEMSRNLEQLDHYVYASSSSVYATDDGPASSIKDRVDSPRSIYAASKKASEMLSHSYSHLYRLPMTGLRFFTVYGPWGRPDMAAFIFTKKILAGVPIQVFNNGEMCRDFTYIDDVVDGILKCLDNPPIDTEAAAPCRVYNIGNHQSEKLMDMISLIEKTLGRKADVELLPMQAGDNKESYADISETQRDLGFEPKTSIDQGIPLFVEWYRRYYDE